MSSDYDAMRNMETRMNKMAQRIHSLETDAEELKRVMSANTAALEEFIDLGKALKVGLKLAGYVERVALFVTKLAAAGTVLWATWRFAIKEALAHLIK